VGGAFGWAQDKLRDTHRKELRLCDGYQRTAPQPSYKKLN